jgi:hypothetical protein
MFEKSVSYSIASRGVWGMPMVCVCGRYESRHYESRHYESRAMTAGNVRMSGGPIGGI